MSSFSKTQQLSKARRINPKKMTAIEKELYETFILNKTNGKCQLECGREGQDFHHSKRGINKDDRSIVLVCRRCHTLIHNVEYKNIDESSRLTLLAKDNGFLNWMEYNG